MKLLTTGTGTGALLPLLPPLLLLGNSPTPATAQDDTTQLSVLRDVSAQGYGYVGCFNDTDDLPDTWRTHALTEGIWTLPVPTEAEKEAGGGEAGMTVQRCLEHCATVDLPHSPFEYAGLQYSRECYCGNRLNSLAVELPEARCATACDGDQAHACGGANALSVYKREDGGGYMSGGRNDEEGVAVKGMGLAGGGGSFLRMAVAVVTAWVLGLGI